MVLPTDAALFEDPGFNEFAEKYVEDEAVFFKDYAESHAKLSELGSKFSPPKDIYIDPKTPTGTKLEMGPLCVLMKEEDKVTIQWTLIMQECGLSITIQQLKLKVVIIT